jgi:protein-S-isoprenylcysteine O-methyltransferase Ste14
MQSRVPCFGRRSGPESPAACLIGDRDTRAIIRLVPRPRFGSRGESYVAVQFLLLALVIAGPTQVAGWPGLLPDAAALRALALILSAAGALLLVAGGRRLGRNLTPLPVPKATSTFVNEGVYRYARHPIYGGLILLAFGWSLRRGGGLALVYVGLLVGLLLVKSRVEERWLARRYEGYLAYRARTRRFLPFVW